MAKLLRNIALFSLPIWALLVWMLLHEPTPAYRYRMVQKDCRTGSWIYRRLFESPDPIDIAFVGSSKTMCDVNDALLEERLTAATGKQLRIANLGVCRVGENLHYLITRDLFVQKRPQYLIYEVSTDLATQSHFHFPYVATASDVISAPILLNDDYLEDLTTLLWNRLVHHREQTLGITRSFEDFLTDSLHSFMVVGADMVADSNEMARLKGLRQQSLTEALPSGIAGWIYALRARHPKYYLRAVQTLCAASGTKLVFLYLPSYGAPAKRPQEFAFLETMGTLWVPPDSIVGDPRLHFDHTHLNMAGATKLSDWLTRQLVGLVGE